MLSIDQNSHSLWDVLPKLQVLARRGRRVTHFVEDIDTAFTALGSEVDADDLRLARERFHRSGGANWGAALFYTEFLGRVPVEIRDWEPLTGLKTNVLAKQLGRSVDDLYDEFSPGDNWQLIGSSFIGDRHHHRVVGDLSVGETAEFLRQLMEKAEQDMRRAFPSQASQGRIGEWFAGERRRVARLLDELAGTRLVDLYRRWLGEYLGDAVALNLTSRLFACEAGPSARTELLEVFLADPARAAGLYNEAIDETGSKLRPLRADDGELPFFAAFEHAGHLVRCGVFLDGDAIRIGERTFPLAEGRRLPLADLAEAGIRSIAGKALLLVSQVRLGEAGRPLALPHRGSLYMPTAHALAGKLAAGGLLPGGLKPVVRVRLRLLDRLRSLQTPIRLPGHLAAAMGEQEVSARRLGEAHEGIVADAKARLEAFADDAGRQRWQRDNCGDLLEEIDRLDGRRRELAQADPKDPKLREVWKTSSGLQQKVLDRTLRQINRDSQVAELDFYDTRGAALPWCVALGGLGFYNQVIEQAEVHEEGEVQVAGHG